MPARPCSRARRANTIDMAMADEIRSTVHALEEDPQVRGFVLSSSVPGIFSAGLHLPELLLDDDGSVDQLAAYWTSVQEMWMALYTTPLATVAAIPGHCIAGGCVLSLSCDANIMAEGEGTIGLNETSVGLVTPSWMSNMVVDLVGRRQAETLLQRGLLLPPEQALKLGLVDQTVPLSDLATEAHARLHELLAVPDSARADVKQQLRLAAADRLRDEQSEDLDAFVRTTASPAVQEALRQKIDELKEKKKKADP